MKSDTLRTDAFESEAKSTLKVLSDNSWAKRMIASHLQFERENQQLKAERDTAHQSVHKWSNKSVELAEQVVALKAELKVCAEALNEVCSGHVNFPEGETNCQCNWCKALSQPHTQSLLQ